MSQAGVEVAGRDWGLFARAAGYGAAAAFALFYVLHLGVGTSPRQASEVAFPLAALPFAVGLVGWSGVLMSGDAIEGFSTELGVSEGWTAESGRQAMALLIAFGLGGMVGAAVAGAPYGV
ncbi:DUF7268 family protein [Halobacterium jilantaiense]|uniref:Uncharacterized protein n=1 Tax=Halobacterium jilantaiense TaxID=355548 RepID=A0A1I0PH81_9EURY|nr:hypothetical protein [Halobacterium jilantaiense]SEW13610.1 hypothetical protein SAMN04487945_1682 [Halobacterium jilantaiense]